MAITMRGAIRISLGAALAAALVLAYLPAAAEVPPVAPGGGPEYAPSQLLVRFQPSAPEEERARVRARHDLEKVENLPLSDLERVRMRGRATPPEQAQRVSGEPSVRYAEPNFVWRPDHVPHIPNDTRFSQLWGLHNTGQTGGTNDADVDFPEAGRHVGSAGESIVVGVIDTGVQIAHEDLAANVWTNPGEVPGNGLDDDANGFVDDVNGWDFWNDDNTVFDNPKHDDHGTHVAGTIAAVMDNAKGVAGVSQARIMTLKFIGPAFGTTAGAIQALNYAINKGAKLTNNSWGGGGFSQALKDKIQEANVAGQLFVAAAGNDGVNTDTSPHYPSSFDNANIVSVAATTDQDNLASFSNFGATTVDLGAPGVGILSTLPSSKYGSGSGTSMATPHVSGAAAQLHAASHSLTHLQVKDLLLAKGDPKAALTGKTVSGRRLNLANALGSWLDASLNNSGKVTTAVGSGIDFANAVAMQGDGKILTAGRSHNGSNFDFALARYNSDGSLDATFDGDGKVTTAIGGGDDQAYAVALQGDGKIVAAGISHNGTNFDFAVVRYNATGSLDSTFDADGVVTTPIGSGSDLAVAAFLDGSGRIVAAGSSHNGANFDFAAARYTSSGALDTTFDADGKTTTAFGSGNDFGQDAALDGSGRIVVGGISHNGADYDVALARYTSGGSLDTTFSGDGKVTAAVGSGHDVAYEIAIQSDGKIVAAGASSNGANFDFGLARFNADGSLDTAFDADGKVTTAVGGGNDYAYAVALQSDGKIVAAGAAHNGADFDFAVARYNTNGSLDTTFSGDGKVTTAVGPGSDFALDVAIDSTGDIVAAGQSFNGTNFDFALARYRAA